MEFALQEYGGTEESIRNGLFGSAADVRAGVERQVAAGATEIIVFQLPRLHPKSLARFSEEVIPAFR
jgi:alkanesulfonate monooxygenase SsuD/methylene tetrahydromethanopterin reductase-like flavin-dependent oxidoreductase (luciferase family)